MLFADLLSLHLVTFSVFFCSCSVMHDRDNNVQRRSQDICNGRARNQNILGKPPRKFLNFRPHKSHFGVISNSEITLYNHKIRYMHIGLKLRACGKLLAQALDDCGRGVAYRQIDW